MEEGGITAILGLVLLTQPNHSVSIPMELIANGLPENSGVQVREDHASDSLIVSIQSYDDGEG